MDGQAEGTEGRGPDYGRDIGPCGASDSRSGGTQGQVPPTGNGMAIIGMVFTICAALMVWMRAWRFLELIGVLWVLGLLFSVVGVMRSRRGAPYGGLACCGSVICLAGFILVFGLLAIFGELRR